MALVSVGDEGDAITLSRTNKVTLVSMSPCTQATARSCTDKVMTLVFIADGGDAITRCSRTNKVTLISNVTSYLG